MAFFAEHFLIQPNGSIQQIIGVPERSHLETVIMTPLLQMYRFALPPCEASGKNRPERSIQRAVPTAEMTGGQKVPSSGFNGKFRSHAIILSCGTNYLRLHEMKVSVLGHCI